MRVETGRYGRNRSERNERKCLLCANSNDIEDEYHFIILCNVYDDLRVQYLPYYLYMNPSVHKFVIFFNTCKKNNMLRMSKYIKEATERRYIIISEQLLVAICKLFSYISMYLVCIHREPLHVNVIIGEGLSMSKPQLKFHLFIYLQNWVWSLSVTGFISQKQPIKQLTV